MGLDMYLEGVRYIPAERDENGNIIKKREVRKTLLLDWRKNYPIHSYFDNLFNVENCVNYELTYEQLKEFIDKCKMAYLNPDSAESIMPDTWYGTHYDEYDNGEYYIQDFKDTVKELEDIVKDNWFDWFEYHAWW